MGRPSSPPVPRKRAGRWYLIRRVPKIYADIDRRLIVHLSTGVPIRDDPRGILARQVVARLNEELERLWHKAKFRSEPTPVDNFRQGIELARYRYLLTASEHITLREGVLEVAKRYAADFVRYKIFATGALDDLNPEARRIIYLIAETGLRLSEACNLSTATINLLEPVPHIAVRDEGRQTYREVPLIGAALMAMREQPHGFPRYRNNARNASATINKALAAIGLRPHGETVFSLRHTFHDRLRAAGATEAMTHALLGLKRMQPASAETHSLESKAKVIKRVAFRPPFKV